MPEANYNVLDISEDPDPDLYSDSSSSVNSEVFKRICEFDEMFDRQMEDFSTPKRKSEEDVNESPHKSPRTGASPDNRMNKSIDED